MLYLDKRNGALNQETKRLPRYSDPQTVLVTLTTKSRALVIIYKGARRGVRKEGENNRQESQTTDSKDLIFHVKSRLVSRRG